MSITSDISRRRREAFFGHRRCEYCRARLRVAGRHWLCENGHTMLGFEIDAGYGTMVGGARSQRCIDKQRRLLNL